MGTESSRPRPQSGLDRLVRAAAPDLDRDLLAGTTVLDRGRNVVGVGHALAGDGADHVTDLQAGVRGGAAGGDRSDGDAAGATGRRDAQVRAPDRLAALEARD